MTYLPTHSWLGKCSTILIFFATILFPQEKNFYIVIASYNNKDWYQKNLDSVMGQDYPNFHVIYVDDCSPDGTGALIEHYITKNHFEKKITLISRDKRYGALANFYYAIHQCPDDAIIVTIDGDDWLSNPMVLSRLNQEYADPNVWVTYGNYEVYPSGKASLCKPLPKEIIENAWFREHAWVTSALRTFYASLFKHIKLEDLLHHGTFFSISQDLAVMFPILEMAHIHIRFIPDILYIYNQVTPLNDHKLRLIEQLHINSVIRTYPCYKELPSLPEKISRLNEADIIILAHSPETVIPFLKSCKLYLHHAAQTYILYETPTQQTNETFAQQLATTIKHCTANYLLLTRDRFIFTQPFDLKDCIDALEQTEAYGFYGTLSMQEIELPILKHPCPIPPHVHPCADISAWQFKYGYHCWHYPHTFNLALYRKNTCITALNNYQAKTINDLEHLWQGAFIPVNSVGLCFTKSKGIKTLDPVMENP